MILYPAIDLYGQEVVRLHQGRFDKKTRYEVSPLKQAETFRKAGCTWLHIVDLEGAQKGEPCHLNILEDLASTGLSIQYGGGIRTEKHVETALKAGASRIMTGSMVLKAPEGGKGLFSSFGAALVPSLDVKEGTVALGGWTESTRRTAASFLEELTATGFTTFLVTSVSRDGTGKGPDLGLYEELLSLETGAELLAAGGIWTMENLEKLYDLGLGGAVIGKALYETDLPLEDALARWQHA